jgi:hypothetical protein
MPNLEDLTERQKEIYDFISDGYLRGKHVTIREIGLHFGFVSPNGTMCHIRSLIKKGFLADTISKTGMHGRKARSLQPMVVDSVTLLGNDRVLVAGGEMSGEEAIALAEQIYRKICKSDEDLNKLAEMAAKE